MTIVQMISGNFLVLASHVYSHVNNTVNTTDETEIVHIGRKSYNECAVITTTVDRSQKAPWDSGAGKCTLSFNFQ